MTRTKRAAVVTFFGVGHNVLAGLRQVYGSIAVVVNSRRGHTLSHIIPDLVAALQRIVQIRLCAAFHHIDGAVVEADGRRVYVDAAHADHLEALVARGVHGGDGEGAVLGEGDLVAARGIKAVGAIFAPGHGAGLVDGDRYLRIVRLVLCHCQHRRGAVDARDRDGHNGRVARFIGENDIVSTVSGKGEEKGQ